MMLFQVDADFFPERSGALAVNDVRCCHSRDMQTVKEAFKLITGLVVADRDLLLVVRDGRRRSARGQKERQEQAVPHAPFRARRPREVHSGVNFCSWRWSELPAHSNAANDVAPPLTSGMLSTWARRAAKTGQIAPPDTDHVIDDFRQLAQILRDEYGIALAKF